MFATFDTGTVNFSSGVVTPVIPDHLYQIDPATGKTTLIGPTAFSLDTVVQVNGGIYAFQNNISQIDTLNLSNGATSAITSFDPNAGLVFGATPTPEPASILLALIGVASLGISRLKKRT